MAISVTDLPPKYQAQAMKQYMEQQARRGTAPSAAAQEPTKGNKYHNKPTERVTPSGAVLHFDSQKEARRYDALALRLQAGQIRDLRLQVDFTLQEAYTDTEGRRVRAIRYKADFTYWERERQVVEDVKSKPTKTKTYAMKRKMLKDRFGIDITEV
ncbi:MAG: DUF1064 domain-containing protein [Oscillibacter sp.]